MVLVGNSPQSAVMISPVRPRSHSNDPADVQVGGVPAPLEHARHTTARSDLPKHAGTRAERPARDILVILGGLVDGLAGVLFGLALIFALGLLVITTLSLAGGGCFYPGWLPVAALIDAVACLVCVLGIRAIIRRQGFSWNRFAFYVVAAVVIPVLLYLGFGTVVAVCNDWNLTFSGGSVGIAD